MAEDSKDRPVVMISSTALDLPDHRREVLDACLRQNTIPKMQEHLPASGFGAALGAEAVHASLAMVDEAEIYVGVFAHRYGYVSAGNGISLTEMEYDRAVERQIERMIFVMHPDHAVKVSDVETGEGAERLSRLKLRLARENVVNFFTSPADLRANIINSLSQYRERHGKRDVTSFHYVSDIPPPPEPYIAHPYTLLQMRELVGRTDELRLLTDWMTNPHSAVNAARVLNIVAIGGMGKSALTWEWFEHRAAREIGPLAGRMWWSFYESDATFENFVIRALSYVTGRPREEIEQHTRPGEREDALLAALDREPFLIVLDGLERILIAYASMDANRLVDDDLDEQTANAVAGALGLPESAAQSFTGKHQLRKTADPRAGNFLRKLCRVKESRILITTRLYPADLQTITGDALPGSFAYFLRGLTGSDALGLWRAFGVTGSWDDLMRLFHTFEYHPLIIQILASEVAYYRRAPRDFDRWRLDHPDFNPFSLPLKLVKSHVLTFALRGLEDVARQVLHFIAAFRMAATYDTLNALLVGKEASLASEVSLVAILTELEDRGLLGWDRRANRYDLHPVVRGVIWSGLTANAKKGIYESLQEHFESLPEIEDWQQVSSLEDLTTSVELYNTLAGLELYDMATQIFHQRLEYVTLYRLSANRERAELLELLFPDGLHQMPRLKKEALQAFALGALATSYAMSGRPGRAVPMYRDQIFIYEEENAYLSLRTALCNLAISLYHSGALHGAEAAARRAYLIARDLGQPSHEAVALQWVGAALAARGLSESSDAFLQRSLMEFELLDHPQAQGVLNALLAQQKLWQGDAGGAEKFAAKAREFSQIRRHERDLIRAERLRGQVAMCMGDLAAADEYLSHALTYARAVNFVGEELQALIWLAQLRRRSDLRAARELLDDVWEAAERGPYPLIRADACNVLAEVEQDEGNREKAVEAAGKAYELAWCDGPPFAYHWGLEKARVLLRELGAREPKLPAFDASKFEPMPEVELDPADEPGAGSAPKKRKRRKSKRRR